MLRPLAQKSATGLGVIGTYLVGAPASALPVGFARPGLLANDVASSDPVGTLYRVEIVDPPSAGSLSVDEYGAFSFVDAPDGVYTGGMRVYKNNVADTGAYRFEIGEVVEPPRTDIDATKVPAERRVVFEGSKRVVSFEGSRRLVSFEGSIRKVVF